MNLGDRLVALLDSSVVFGGAPIAEPTAAEPVATAPATPAAPEAPVAPAPAPAVVA